MAPEKKKSYDPSCRELAEKFLADVPKLNTDKNKDDLARFLQQALEDWFLLMEIDR